LERNLYDAWGPDRKTAPPGFHLSGTRWRAVALPITLGFVFVAMLLAHRPLVHSDDELKAGVEAFQSPLLIRKFPVRDEALVAISESMPGDLLTNGYMDDPELGFYWRPPNHWIAGGWFEWFSRLPFNFPEFNDGSERNIFHSYPSSQRLQLWGNDYAAGLMQSVTVNPCTYYRFQAYGQSRPGTCEPPPVDVASRMKVGIEPYGWMSGRSIYDYDPGLEPDEFPDTVVWSAEATHNFAFTPYTVTAEALSSTVTVVLFSNPEVDTLGGVWWNDTVWDTASLLEVPPPSGTILDGSSLPEPDGLITNLSIFALPRLAFVEWDTPVPASTQVLYRLVKPSSPVTETPPLTYTVFLPFLENGSSILNWRSSLDTRPVLHHVAALRNLPSKYVIDFVALSRRLTCPGGQCRGDGGTCVTSASSVNRAVSLDEGYAVYTPLVLVGHREE
jgi:hypothetical protein